MGWPMNERAAALIGRSRGVDARLLASVNGSSFVLPVPLQSGGTVSVDGKSAARRSLSCEVQTVITDPAVDPINAEVRAEYGIVDPASGATFWTPVGTFVVTDAVEAGPGLVSLKATDRWQRVVEARFERPRTTSGNTVAAITALLQEADGRITVEADPALVGTHRASLWDRDRDKAILELAKSIGAVVYFDAMGVAQIRRQPSASDPVYWQISAGQGGAKSASRRGASRSRTYNAVVVIGEPGGNAPPVYGVARDTDPASRTRYGGPMGKRPRYYRTSLITTEAQANAAAAGLLARYLGVARTLEVDAAPHPGLEAGDVVLAEVARGTWERHISEAFTLPLGLGTITLATRSNLGEDDGE